MGSDEDRGELYDALERGLGAGPAAANVALMIGLAGLVLAAGKLA